MEGLNKFKEAFEAYSDNYVIIGGTACDFTMSGTVVRPRATHDIDMIVIVEKMTAEFGQRFWQFIREAGYRPEKRRQHDGEPPRYELYRFLDGAPGYPEMIELLSRHPDILGEPKGLTIEPLPVSEDVSSLSAIIMDDDYYHFTIEHSRFTDGIRHADSAALVALKARAYLNLLQEKAEGRHVNSRDIKKHRSDVLKNVVILPNEEIDAPASIVACIKEFVGSIRAEWDELAAPLAEAAFTERVISDFHRIICNSDPLTFADFNREHERCLAFIKKAVAESDVKCKVVVTHHVPSFRMQCPRFKDSLANGAFTVELEDYIEQSGIDFWIYGHSHYNCDAVIGSTACLSNQLGYVSHGEHRTFDAGKFIEVLSVSD